MISIICKMSVDVFGRQLDKSVTSNNHGPPGRPGIGFKITLNGHYDLENKRLCNIAEPEEQNDSVTLNVLNRETRNIIRTLREESNNSNLLLVHGLETTINDISKNLNISLENLQDLEIRNTEIIQKLDNRLTILEKRKNKKRNESKQASVGRGAS